ncbi:hypothetical protein HanHA89_Chr16g0666091 [Helianthus annuus]|nr:hypothetical protein HanHA89_Chr16g0666091 [Helianthus annuus]
MSGAEMRGRAERKRREEKQGTLMVPAAAAGFPRHPWAVRLLQMRRDGNNLALWKGLINEEQQLLIAPSF